MLVPVRELGKLGVRGGPSGAPSELGEMSASFGLGGVSTSWAVSVGTSLAVGGAPRSLVATRWLVGLLARWWLALSVACCLARWADGWAAGRSAVSLMN